MISLVLEQYIPRSHCCSLDLLSLLVLYYDILRKNLAVGPKSCQIDSNAVITVPCLVSLASP